MRPERSPAWERLRGVLKRVAVGPEGSQSLTEAEAHEAMALCLSREVSDIQVAVFLVAMRLKRETFAENLGMLRALEAALVPRVVDADEVVLLSDPFDGYDRVPHFGPVIAAALSACGLPAFVTGAHALPPKYGVTHRQVLEHALGRTGPQYLDVADFLPSLWALTPIREEMAKRTAVATLEKLVRPVQGRRATHLVSGYVHSAYEQLMVELARAQGFATALIVRGREGNVDLHTHRPTTLAGFRGDGSEVSWSLDPGELTREVPPADAETLRVETVAAAWTAALDGQGWPGAQVAVTAGAILHHVGRVESFGEGAALILEGLRDGRARRAFEAR